MPDETSAAATQPEASSTKHGAGRVLITVYAVLAVGATSRSLYELVVKFDQAPFAYTLSAVAAVVYCIITVALVKDTPTWRRVAFVCMVAELVGVLVVGVLSVVDPTLFRAKSSVWFWFGRDYLFVPLVLPILGLNFLRRTRQR